MFIRNLFLGITVLALLVPNKASPFGKQIHSSDMTEVVGLYAKNQKGKESLEKCLNDFASNIDQISYPENINHFRNLSKDELQSFTWGKYGHRLFFHWGFNDDPRRHEPLMIQVEKCNWPAKVQSDFFNNLLKEQSIRNRDMMNSVSQNIYNFNNDRGKINAFAAILYDVHLLGDYIEVGGYWEKKALQSSNRLNKDIIKSIYKLFSAEEARILASNINKIQSLYVSDIVKSREVLKYLKLNFPKEFKRHYGDEFKKLNIDIQ